MIAVDCLCILMFAILSEMWAKLWELTSVLNPYYGQKYYIPDILLSVAISNQFGRQIFDYYFIIYLIYNYRDFDLRTINRKTIV